MREKVNFAIKKAEKTTFVNKEEFNKSCSIFTEGINQLDKLTKTQSTNLTKLISEMNYVE
jgi:hypothetical protein